VNPFTYEQPVSPENLVDRDEEAEELLRRAAEGRNSRLEAPRRYGKTSLLRRLLRDAEGKELVGVYVDFFGVLTLDDVSERIERAYREQLPRGLRAWFAGLVQTFRPVVRAGGGPIPASAEVAIGAAGEGSLLERLDIPRRLHAKHGTRCIVVFDEFQDVLRTRQQVDAVIRSVIQHHGDASSYVFSGSHPGMMRELFSDRRRAFYGQASLVALDTLAADDLAAYLSERFQKGDRDPGEALEPLLSLAAGHPQRAMMLAHHLWAQTDRGTQADTDTWSSTLAAVGGELQGEFAATWARLNAREQRLVTAIADNRTSLFSRQSQATYGIAKTGAYRNSIEELRDTGEIVDADTPTKWRLVDPLLALWVRSDRSWPVRSQQ
jgi:uncharacterized protein